jgi:hypothetical protein
LASDHPDRSGVPVAIHRVVTGHAPDGSSVVAMQSAPPRTDEFKHIPGMVSRLVWSTGPVPALPFAGADPTPAVTNFVPGPGETRFLIVTFPPDAVFGAASFDVEAAIRENLAVSPGLAERFEPDGMHTTPTVDYAIVLDGEIWLELDQGRSTLLRQHDVVIQNGSRHAWRNKSDRNATLAFVLIGAQPQGIAR